MATISAPQIVEAVRARDFEGQRELTPARRRFTVAEYYQMAEAGILRPDERVELIRGEIRVMCPQGPVHAAGGSRADRWFIQQLGDRALVRIQRPIHLSDDSEPEPDLVLAVYEEEEYTEHHPTPPELLLVLEVSDSTLRYDRSEKALLYAQAGIIEYCVLNLKARELEDYRDPSPEGYRSKLTYTAAQSFNLVAFPDVAIPVNALLPPVKTTTPGNE
jgi:Uma2 family endonuclease